MSSITRTAQSSRAQRRDEIRRDLLTAVEGLLAEESYTELSVERIVKAAGISRSTFYVYFEDKGDLLQALTTEVVTELIAAASRWWELPPSARKDEVREALGGLVDCYRRHRLLMRAVAEVSTYDQGVRERFGAMVDQAVEGVAGHLRAGQEQGFVHPDIDADGTAEWMTRMTERGLLMLVAPATPAQAERLLDGLTELVWNVFYEGMR